MPAVPGAPWRPAAPVAPAGPVAPVAPGRPGRPVAPAGPPEPAAPVAPVAPAGPGRASGAAAVAPLPASSTSSGAALLVMRTTALWLPSTEGAKRTEILHVAPGASVPSQLEEPPRTKSSDASLTPEMSRSVVLVALVTSTVRAALSVPGAVTGKSMRFVLAADAGVS